MTLYERLLSKGKEAIADLERPFKVRKEKKNLEMRILELEQQQAKDELTIQEQKSAHPVEWDKLVKAINDKALNDRKLEQLRSLESEMFGDSKTE